MPVFLPVFYCSFGQNSVSPSINSIKGIMENNCVIEAFFEVCRKVDFQDKWMSATTWAEIVCQNYNSGADAAFDGNKLVHAISHNKVLNSLFEGNDGMVKEDIAVFWNKYQARGMTKQVHYFYATWRGERPKGVNASSQ